MTHAHPPQEILTKVMCSERLPSKTGYYCAVIKESEDYIYFNHITKYWYHSKYQIVQVFPSHWYEPATRVVLTVEELNSKIASIAKTVTEKQRAAKEEQTDGVYWNTLEEIWFDWIKEQFIGNEDDTDNP